jgi:hypothetical protein
VIGNLAVGIQDFVIPAPQGDFESIATVTVGAGGSATISFTSIPGTYQHLQLRIISRDSAQNNQSLFITFNSDTGSNYNLHRLYGTGGATGSDSVTNSTYMICGSHTNTSSTFGAGVTDILDYANTNKFKTIRSLNGWENNSDGRFFFVSGAWRSTSAITSISIKPEANSFAQYSHFALYGIKG